MYIFVTEKNLLSDNTMKKNYKKPETKLFQIEVENYLLAASGRGLLIDETQGYDDEGMFLPGRRK